MRTLLHVGLAALLTLAPALCCCNVRLFTGRAAASPNPTRPSCCHPKPVCCHEKEKAETPAPAPAAPEPPACKCFGERPDATPPEAAPTVADPEPTGELVPLGLLGLAGVSPEHLGLVGGLGPPERAGVDARSAALFDRHVLRC